MVVGIESRGFIWGAILAYEMGVGFVPVRKPDKLPAETIRAEYALEYGTNDPGNARATPSSPGKRCWSSTTCWPPGGTAKATCELVEQLGGEVAGMAFLIELTFLPGRDKLAGYDVLALIPMDE